MVAKDEQSALLLAQLGWWGLVACTVGLLFVGVVNPLNAEPPGNWAAALAVATLLSIVTASMRFGFRLLVVGRGRTAISVGSNPDSVVRESFVAVSLFDAALWVVLPGFGLIAAIQTGSLIPLAVLEGFGWMGLAYDFPRLQSLQRWRLSLTSVRSD